LNKMNSLNAWIDREQAKLKIKKFDVNAVILAPFMQGQSFMNTTIVVTGDEAIDLLGGLSRILIFENFK